MSLGMTMAFLGAGNIAEALIRGLRRAKVATPKEVLCTDRRLDRGPELTERYGVRFSHDNLAAVREADIVVLLVKPQAMNRLLDESCCWRRGNTRGNLKTR